MTTIFVLIAALGATPKGTPKEPAWATATKSHDGHPLLLRRPTNLDVAALTTRYPKLVVIEHTFTQVTSDGLPEAAYNRSLEDLDHDLVSLFDKPREGAIVLVETFGGTRQYYFYASTDAAAAAAARLAALRTRHAARYGKEKIALSSQDDPEWKLFHRYAKEYF